VVGGDNVIEVKYFYFLTFLVTKYIPEMFAKLTGEIKVDILKSVSHFSSLSIASPLGIPLTLNFTTLSIFKVDGHLKVKDLFDISTLFKFPISIPKMTLEIELKPTFDTFNYFVLGANMRWLSGGVGFDGRLRTTFPSKLDVILDGPEHKAVVKFYNPGKVSSA